MPVLEVHPVKRRPEIGDRRTQLEKKWMTHAANAVTVMKRTPHSHHSLKTQLLQRYSYEKHQGYDTQPLIIIEPIDF
jgi:hypothetical protein